MPENLEMREASSTPPDLCGQRMLRATCYLCSDAYAMCFVVFWLSVCVCSAYWPSPSPGPAWRTPRLTWCVASATTSVWWRASRSASRTGARGRSCRHPSRAGTAGMSGYVDRSHRPAYPSLVAHVVLMTVQGLDLEGYMQWLQSRKNGATPSCPLCHKPMYIDEVKVMNCSLPGLRELRHSTTMADSL